MGTIEPWRTPFGSAQHAQANHPPPGHGKSIIKGLFSATVPIRLVLNQTHVDPSPVPHGFARLGLALFRPLGPLDSFSSRIAMAYRLGLICEGDFDALDLLRKIRNDCAHAMTPFSLEAEPHLGRFAEFTALTCQKDNLFLCMGGVICPQTTEDWAIMTCICHVVYMEKTLGNLEQIPD